MFNIDKQVAYWQTGAEEELINAGIMIENERLLAGLLFCHLCIEKMLKAIVVKKTEAHPARTHNLLWLAETALVVFDEKQEHFISILQVYQLEGRYPDNFPYEPDIKKANEYLEHTKILYKWLREML